MERVIAGKKVFGWSLVGSNGVVVIPDEAMKEYKIGTGGSLLLIPSSGSSGGFGLTSIALLKDTRLGMLLKGAMEASVYSETKPAFIEVSQQKWYSVELGADLRSFTLPAAAMKEYEIMPGDRLLVVKGSGNAIGFVPRGKIFDEAAKHVELKVFKPLE